jgi:ADP-heptose:LPS heptosyltransferase
LPSSQPAPILVIHQGALGDLLMSLPALSALRRYHQENPWTLVGNPQNLALLGNGGYGKNILSGHDRRWAGLLQTKKALSETFRQFLGTFERAYLFSKKKPEEFLRGLEEGGVQKTFWVPSFPDEQKRIPLQTLQREMFKAHALPWEETGEALSLTEGDRREGRRCLETLNLASENKPVWAIHPGSGSPHKNWPLARFMELARLIKDRKAAQPLFLLGPVEAECWGDALGRLQETQIPIIKAPPLPVLAGLLTHCTGYVGNDSGVSHLAAALGMPSVVLFGPTDPLLWAPQGRAVQVLFASRSCSPCLPERRAACSDRVCLTDLSVAKVLESIISNQSGSRFL